MILQSVIRYRCLTIVFGTLMVFGVEPATATTRPRIWVQVFQELNDGRTPEWTNHKQAEEWVIRESARLEPIVLSIVKGERADIQWTAGLAIAHIIPTQSIRDELQRIMHDMLRTPRGVPLGQVDEMGLTHIIDILTMNATPEFLADVREILRDDNSSRSLVEHSVKAMQKVGKPEDLELLRRIRLHNRGRAVQDNSLLAERFIEERAAGRDPFANSAAGLRLATRNWVAALEAKDYDAYRAVLPYGGGGFDRHDFFDEILPGAELPGLLEATRREIDTATFEIDRDNLEASCVIAGRYKFLYILEPEGWKTGGPIRIAP